MKLHNNTRCLSLVPPRVRHLVEIVSSYICTQTKMSMNSNFKVHYSFN